MLAAGDTFRAAAVEQLQVWGERNDVPVIAQATGADPAAVVFDALQAARARRIDVLIADTAGRLHTQSNLMDELKKVKRVMGRVDERAPHEVLLVLDASQGQNALQQARLFNEALGVTGIVLTKLDGTAKGGIVFAIASELQLPIRYIGIGESAEDFATFDAEAFVDALLKRDEHDDPLRSRLQTLSERPRGAQRPVAGDRRGRDRVPHRPFRRRQIQPAEADRADRAAEPRPADRQRPERRRHRSRARCRRSGARSAWCSRITSCCTTARSSTTSRCR